MENFSPSSQVNPGLEKGYLTRRVIALVGSILRVNSYRRLTKEGLLVGVIQLGLKTNPRSCKQVLRAKDLIFCIPCLPLAFGN